MSPALRDPPPIFSLIFKDFCMRFQSSKQTWPRPPSAIIRQRERAVIVPRARGATARRRRALPPLARAHAPQGPTDCTRGARGSPRPVQAREEAPRWKPRRKSGFGFVNDPRNDGPGPALGAGVSRPRDVREGVVQGRGVPRRAVAPPRAAVPVHSPAARRRAAHRQRGSVRGASRANTRLFEAFKASCFFSLSRKNAKDGPDASTNRRGPPPRLTHDPRARASFTRALRSCRSPLVSFTTGAR